MAWKRIQPKIDPVLRSVIDPYAYWALGPGLQDFLLPSVEEQSIPVLLRRKAEPWDEKAWEIWRDAAGDPHMLERPPSDAEPFDVRLLPIAKTRQLIEDGRFLRFFEGLERFTLGPPLPSSSVAPHRDRKTR